MKAYRLFDTILCFFGKAAIFLVGGIAVLAICFVAFVYASPWLWPDFYGSYSLGNNIYMLEGDRGRKTIVYGTTVKGNTCYSGEPIIPTYENQYDSLGNIAEYVIDAKADVNWIITKTDNRLNYRRKFYIIDKRFDSNNTEPEDIRKNYTYEYDDSIQLIKASKEKNIPINDLMPK